MEECFFVVKGNRNYVLIGLIFLFALGTFLRFHQLGEESIWVDEAFTDHYTSGSWGDIITFLKKDVHPLGFYALEYRWIDNFGNSEFSLRFIPAVFGSLSVLFFFFVVRELYDRRTALLSTLFFSWSYTFILYSQEAKMYGQFIFFLLAVFWSFMLFLKKPSLTNAMLLTLGNIGLLHTQILSVPIIAGEAFLYLLAYVIYKRQNEDLFFLCFTKKAEFDMLKFVLVLGVVAFSYLLWLPVFYFQFHRLFLDMLPLKFAQKFGFAGFYLFMLIAIAVFLGAVSASFYLVYNKKTYAKIRNFVTNQSFPRSIFVIIFLIWLGVNLLYHKHFFGNLFYIRYLLFLFPFWYIFIVRKLFRVSTRTLVVLLSLYLLVTSFILFQYYTVDGKEQWREAAGYVQQEARANDVLLFHTAGHTHWAFNYYYNGLLPQVKLKVKGDAVKISSAVQDKEYAFLILSHNSETKEYFKEVLDRQYQLEESREFIGVKVYKYLVR